MKSMAPKCQDSEKDGTNRKTSDFWLTLRHQNNWFSMKFPDIRENQKIRSAAVIEAKFVFKKAKEQKIRKKTKASFLGFQEYQSTTMDENSRLMKKTTNPFVWSELNVCSRADLEGKKKQKHGETSKMRYFCGLGNTNENFYKHINFRLNLSKLVLLQQLSLIFI